MREVAQIAALQPQSFLLQQFCKTHLVIDDRFAVFLKGGEFYAIQGFVGFEVSSQQNAAFLKGFAQSRNFCRKEFVVAMTVVGKLT